MCIGMGMLQLVFQEFLERAGELTFWRILAGLAMLGGAGMYLWGALPRATKDIGILGAGILLVGFAAQAVESRRARYAYPLPQIALLLACGMGIHIIIVLAADAPYPLASAPLAPPEGLRWRMLRLAQMAAIALPVLAYLFEGVAERFEGKPELARWGRVGMLAGAAGMPVLLVLAAMQNPEFKDLLAFPVGATVLGTWVAAWMAWSSEAPGNRGEAMFWAIIGLSMAVGQWMGTFAFDGPLPAPAWMQDYLTYARRAIRLAHTYGIMLGIAGIFLTRRAETNDAYGIARGGLRIFTVGTILTLGALIVASWSKVAGWVLATGPATVALGAGVSLIAARVRGRD